MSPEEFLQLLQEGGAIISSDNCTPSEISEAEAEGRHYTDADGNGYVYDPML